MKIALVYSALDPAGLTIRDHLRAKLSAGAQDAGPFQWGGHTLFFHEAPGRLIHEDGLDAACDADLILFISRHTSQNPFPALTVHVTGNYRDAALGGSPQTLSQAAPSWMHVILRRLAVHVPEGYRVSYEVTHHGPTDLQTPSCFVEIGSTETEWTDNEAGNAVATSILEAIASGPGETISFIGFGGNHYAARETAIALGSRGAFGHIAHTRETEGLDSAMIRQMAEKTVAVAAYIDRKALPKEVTRHLMECITELGLPLLREGEITGLGDLSWETWLKVRAVAEETCPGGSVLIGNLTGQGVPVCFTLPSDLLEMALRMDHETVERTAERLPLATIINPQGSNSSVFITYDPYRSQMIHDLISLCVKIITSDPSVAVRNDDLVIRRERFDPKKAVALAIPKGPLFGKLAAGHSVTVDGKEITPTDVSATGTTVISVPGLERYL